MSEQKSKRKNWKTMLNLTKVAGRKKVAPSDNDNDNDNDNNSENDKIDDEENATGTNNQGDGSQGDSNNITANRSKGDDDDDNNHGDDDDDDDDELHVNPLAPRDDQSSMNHDAEDNLFDDYYDYEDSDDNDDDDSDDSDDGAEPGRDADIDDPEEHGSYDDDDDGDGDGDGDESLGFDIDIVPGPLLDLDTAYDMMEEFTPMEEWINWISESNEFFITNVVVLHTDENKREHDETLNPGHADGPHEQEHKGEESRFRSALMLVEEADQDPKPMIVLPPANVLLVVVRCEGEEYTVLVARDRPAAAKRGVLELPVVSVDENSNDVNDRVADAISRDISQCMDKTPANDDRFASRNLRCLTEMAYGEGAGIATSPEVSQEYVRIHLATETVKRHELEKLQLSMKGVMAKQHTKPSKPSRAAKHSPHLPPRDFSLRLINIKDAWKKSPDIKTLSALCLYEQLKENRAIVV